MPEAGSTLILRLPAAGCPLPESAKNRFATPVRLYRFKMSDRANDVPQSPPSVYEHVYMMFETITHVSWQKLGLQPDTITGRLEVNLPEAKVAIDLTAHLAGVLESQLDDEDRRRVQNLVRDLRLNFIQRNGTEAK